MYAIDLFCGAGGFSEGILQAGFHIVYSSDKSPFVKETYTARHEQLGLEDEINTHFELADIKDLEGTSILKDINKLKYFQEHNKSFKKGDIDVIFGGPPCQGFSIAGKRDREDPRNMLFGEYLRVVKELLPKYVVMENVEGFLSMEVNPNFKSSKKGFVYPDKELVSKVVITELEYFGYTVLAPRRLDASDYGVPQRRGRVIVLASRNDMPEIKYPLPTTKQPEKKVTVLEALSGVSINSESAYSNLSRQGRTPHFYKKSPVESQEDLNNIEESNHQKFIEERFSLFEQGESVKNLKDRLVFTRGTPAALHLKKYPALLQETLLNINKEYNIDIVNKYLKSENITTDNSYLNSIYRTIKKVYGKENSEIKKEFVKKFKEDTNWSEHDIEWLIDSIDKKFNQRVSEEELINWFLDDGLVINGLSNDDILNHLLTNKNTRKRLQQYEPGPTMVTLPDDYIHPTLNKILNVREMARIQSFDDSFIFKGKRTTGGSSRKHEVPQFSQVGNAVPPLLAYAIAKEVQLALMQV